MTQTEKRLVLRYTPGGQFTFRHIRQDAEAGQYLGLARALNSFQTDELDRALIVTTIQF